jgi:hypothetical protein
MGQAGPLVLQKNLSHHGQELVWNTDRWLMIFSSICEMWSLLSLWTNQWEAIMVVENEIIRCGSNTQVLGANIMEFLKIIHTISVAIWLFNIAKWKITFFGCYIIYTRGSRRPVRYTSEPLRFHVGCWLHPVSQAAAWLGDSVVIAALSW